MEKEDVLAEIRALLTASTDPFNIRRLQREFREENGCDLPTFGYRNVADFLRSIPDTVKLIGEYPNEEVRLVKSEKSSHVVALVDNQRVAKSKRRRRRGGNGYGRRSDFRRDERRDTRPPRPGPSSYNNRSYSSSNVPPRLQNSYNSKPSYNSQPPSLLATSVASVSPYDKSRLHEFLRKYPNGATFEEVTRHMLDQGEKWSKYYIQDGVPELVKHCKNFCTISGNKVFTNEYYDDFMRRTKVEVPANGYMPAGNESDYSSDELFDEYDSEEDKYAQNYVQAQQYSDKPKLAKQCDIHTFKNRLKDIVRKYENGIYCSDLFHVYAKFFDEELETHDYGYSSLIEMLKDMPDIVSCSKAGDRDWKIYSVTEKVREEDKLSDASSDSISVIKSNLVTLLRSKNGVLENEIPPLYYKMFNTKLEYRELGYENFQSFINTFENEIFYRSQGSQKSLLFPIEEKKVNGCASSYSPSQKVSAKSLYPEEVVGPNESIPKLDLRDYAAVGEYIEVVVQEIWNPSKFFLQLRKFKADLWELMENLQNFYKKVKDHYHMPQETLVPDQICAALYDLDDDNSEWHRAMIVKVIDEERILVNLIDYGTLTKIEKKRLRFLNKDFATLPCQAFMARLANTEPKKGLTKWPQEASKRFVDLIFSKDLVAGVVEMDYKKCWMSVALSFTEGTEIHISDTLVQEGLASFTDVISGGMPKEQIGPKKAMKSNDIFVLEDEPEVITEVLNSSNESNNPKPETSFSNTPLLNPNAASTLNPNLLATTTALLTTLANPLASLPLVPNLINPQTLLNPGIPLAQNAIPQTTLDPTSILINQMAGLSLNTAVPTVTTPKTPPGFGTLPQVDPQEDLRNKINATALQLYINQPEISIMALRNPEMALQIAIKIAENLYMPKEPIVPAQAPQNVSEPINIPTSKSESISERLESMSRPPTSTPNVAMVFPSVKTDVSQPAATEKKMEKVTGVPRRKIQVLPFEESSPSDNEVLFAIDDENFITPEKKNSIVIKESRLQKKPIHIIILNKELFVLVEEIIKNFTPFSNKKVVDQIVNAKRCSFKYRKITPFSDPDIYQTINRANISKVIDNENELTILPLKSMLKYLRTAVNVDEAGLTAIVRFIQDCEDENRA